MGVGLRAGYRLEELWAMTPAEIYYSAYWAAERERGEMHRLATLGAWLLNAMSSLGGKRGRLTADHLLGKRKSLAQYGSLEAAKEAAKKKAKEEAARPKLPWRTPAPDEWGVM